MAGPAPAQAQVAQPPPAPQASVLPTDATGALVWLLGAWLLGQLGKWASNAVQGLVGRVVKREDADKQELKEALGKVQAAFDEHKGAVDRRITEQGNWYRAELEKHRTETKDLLKQTEISLRRDQTQAMHDAVGLASEPPPSSPRRRR